MLDDLSRVIDLGNGFTINLANERWRTQGFRAAVAASSGGGKSYLVGVMIEEMRKLGVPVLVIDAEGEYRSLAQLGGMMIAGQMGNVALDKLGWMDQVLEWLELGLGVVVDLYKLKRTTMFVYYTDLIWALIEWQRKRREADEHEAMVLVVEEAHIYAPQKRVKSQDAVDVTIEVSQRGRKDGINTIFATQRPNALEKDVLSQSNIRFIGRLEEDNDFEAVKSILPRQYYNDDYKRMQPMRLETLQGLRTGEFFVRIGPDFHRLAPVRARRTKDLAQTPLLGRNMVQLQQVLPLMEVECEPE